MQTETSPTTAITCPHGGLAPRTKRVALPGALWCQVKSLWEAAAEAAQDAAREKAAAAAVKRKGAGKGADAADAGAAAAAAGMKEEEDGEVVLLDVEDEEAAAAAAASRGGGGAAGGREAAAGGGSEADDIKLVSDSVDGTTAGEAAGTGGAAAAGSGSPPPAAPASLPQLPALLDFPAARTRVCEACRQQAGEARVARDEIRRGIDVERGALPMLAANTEVALTAGAPYALVPRWGWSGEGSDPDGGGGESWLGWV